MKEAAGAAQQRPKRLTPWSRRAVVGLGWLCIQGAGAWTSTAHAASGCPAAPVAAGADFSGQTLVGCNFNGADLSGSNFRGATLIEVVFIRAKLTQADFGGATFASGGNPGLANDFTFADLSGASFAGARFAAPTYFTYATLACTDFSRTQLIAGTAIFGDAALKLAPVSQCRTKFAYSAMSCEFVAQWNQLDLSFADIGACVTQLQTVSGRAPYDFSNGVYSNVVFDKLDLSGTRWDGAVLEGASFQGATLDNAIGLNGTTASPSRLAGARFNGASVKSVDLSNAQLYGATFDNANLSGSNLSGSLLTANPQSSPPIVTAASFDGAHMKDVSLANARLTGASLQYATLYSSFGGGTPSFPCDGQAKAGRTCATAAGADLTNSDFGNAYLYGVDFGGSTTVVNGTVFESAILVGANFTGASFQVNGGGRPDFNQALLQGAQFSSDANLSGSDLQNAFFDFGAAGNPNVGNILMLQLSNSYTNFNGWTGAQPPCVQAVYSAFSAVPTNVPLICPNGSTAVCGASLPAPNANPSWGSRIALAQNTPVAGYYLAESTYDPAQPDTQAMTCNGRSVDPNWSRSP